MNNKFLLNIHLYLASILTPILLLISLSGGLYLFGYKGTTESAEVYRGPESINLKASDLNAEVQSTLVKLNIHADFEYIKSSGGQLITRPTSSTYYVLKKSGNELVVTKHEPDLIKSMVELHKGHGPTIFKTLQKVTAIGLIIVILVGLMMALNKPRRRKGTLISVGVGLAIFCLAAFL